MVQQYDHLMKVVGEIEFSKDFYHYLYANHSQFTGRLKRNNQFLNEIKDKRMLKRYILNLDAHLKKEDLVWWKAFRCLWLDLQAKAEKNLVIRNFYSELKYFSIYCRPLKKDGLKKQIQRSFEKAISELQSLPLEKDENRIIWRRFFQIIAMFFAEIDCSDSFWARLEEYSLKS